MFNIKTKSDAIKEEKEKELQRQNEEQEKLMFTASKIFSNKNGVYLLKFLKKICLWDSENTNVDKEILAYRAGRRDVWLILRTLIPKEILADVEIYNK